MLLFLLDGLAWIPTVYSLIAGFSAVFLPVSAKFEDTAPTGSTKVKVDSIDAEGDKVTDAAD